MSNKPHFRTLTVLAQDPTIGITTTVKVPNERIYPGPMGRRIAVVDYDSTRDEFYGEHDIGDIDYYAATDKDIGELVDDPRFHAQNVYGVAASTLFEFEQALGRHLSWGFEGGSHQLKIFPHAFLEANAFFSKNDECLAFGYFPDQRENNHIFTCLSHDIITHETTHALLDGLRGEFVRPSSRDQAAFHEGFADIVALLKVLKNKSIIKYAIRDILVPKRRKSQIVSVETVKELLQQPSFLNGLAQQMAQGMGTMNRDALRRSIDLETSLSPDQKEDLYEDQTQFNQPHERGEILVAAVMNAFLQVWLARLSGKVETGSDEVAVWRVEEEGAKAANHLLSILIRAIDYLPPVNMNFCDFLSAILTADWQVCPDDSHYGYRAKLLDAFGAYGIWPAYEDSDEERGVWGPGFDESEIVYPSGNLDSLQTNPEAVFNFLWTNQKALKLSQGVYTRVSSVRPVWRTGPSGFVLRETVAEYYQLDKKATRADMERLKFLRIPRFMKDGMEVEIMSGGALIFDEFGRLKFHVYNRLTTQSQHDRLEYLWDRGLLRRNEDANPFAALHRDRSFKTRRDANSGWA